MVILVLIIINENVTADDRRVSPGLSFRKGSLLLWRDR